VKVCQQGSWNVLRVVEREDGPYKLYARKPDEITKDLAAKIYGEAGEEYV
jgi:hypothetical protein